MNGIDVSKPLPRKKRDGRNRRFALEDIRRYEASMNHIYVSKPLSREKPLDGRNRRLLQQKEIAVMNGTYSPQEPERFGLPPPEQARFENTSQLMLPPPTAQQTFDEVNRSQWVSSPSTVALGLIGSALTTASAYFGGRYSARNKAEKKQREESQKQEKESQKQKDEFQKQKDDLESKFKIEMKEAQEKFQRLQKEERDRNDLRHKEWMEVIERNKELVIKNMNDQRTFDNMHGRENVSSQTESNDRFFTREEGGATSHSFRGSNTTHKNKLFEGLSLPGQVPSEGS